MRVRADEFSAAIELELDNYGGEVRQGVAAALKKAANICVRLLRENSPRDKGSYAKSWTQKTVERMAQRIFIIYNRDYGWLAHLLENGHAKAAGGRVEGRPHIRPAAEQAQRQLLEEIEKIL